MTGLVCCALVMSPRGTDLTRMSALQASQTPAHRTALPDTDTSCLEEGSHSFQAGFRLSVAGCHLGHHHMRVPWDRSSKNLKVAHELLKSWHSLAFLPTRPSLFGIFGQLALEGGGQTLCLPFRTSSCLNF